MAKRELVDCNPTHYGVAWNDPVITKAMEAYERFDEVERANVFRMTVLAVAGYGRSRDTSHLVKFAHGVDDMLRLEEAAPGLRESLRAYRD